MKSHEIHKSLQSATMLQVHEQTALQVFQLSIERGGVSYVDLAKLRAVSRGVRDMVGQYLRAGQRASARGWIHSTLQLVDSNARGVKVEQIRGGIEWLIATAGISPAMLLEDSPMLVMCHRPHKSLIEVLLAAGVEITFELLAKAARQKVEGVHMWIEALCNDKAGSSGLPIAAEAIWCRLLRGEHRVGKDEVVRGSDKLLSLYYFILNTCSSMVVWWQREERITKILFKLSKHPATAQIPAQEVAALFRWALEMFAVRKVPTMLIDECVKALLCLPAVQVAATAAAAIPVDVVKMTVEKGIFQSAAAMLDKLLLAEQTISAQQVSASALIDMLDMAELWSAEPFSDADKVAERLCKLRAAMELWAEDIYSLLVKVIQGNDRGTSETDMVALLVQTPAGQLMSGSMLGELVELATQQCADGHDIGRNYDIIEVLLQQPAASSMPAAAVNKLLHAALELGVPMEDYKMLCQLAPTLQLTLDQLEGLLDHAVTASVEHWKQHSAGTSYLVIDGAFMMAHVPLNPERLGRLFRSAIHALTDKSSRSAVFKQLAALPVAQQVPATEVHDLLRLAVQVCGERQVNSRAAYSCIGGICTLPAAKQLLPKEISLLLEYAVECRAHCRRLLRLPAAARVQHAHLTATMQMLLQLSKEKHDHEEIQLLLSEPVTRHLPKGSENAL